MTTLNKEPAAYVLTHRPTGKFYVGSTANAKTRMSVHLASLNRGAHQNKNLQDTFTSLEDFDVQVTPAESVEAARDLEQQLLDTRLSDPLCCNVAPGARAPWKGGVPDEIRQRMSTAMTGHAVSDSTREAVRKANTGLKRSDEVKLKMSLANKGQTRSDEAKANMKTARDAHFDSLPLTVFINGVGYKTMQDAATKLGVNYQTLVTRVKSDSPKWAGWMVKT
jgi:group I intron endonuclease